MNKISGFSFSLLTFKPKTKISKIVAIVGRPARDDRRHADADVDDGRSQATLRAGATPVLLRGGNQARTFPAARRLQVLLHLLLTYEIFEKNTYIWYEICTLP
jgi:hypothetical protein